MEPPSTHFTHKKRPLQVALVNLPLTLPKAAIPLLTLTLTLTLIQVPIEPPSEKWLPNAPVHVDLKGASGFGALFKRCRRR